MQSVAILSFVLLGLFLILTYSSTAEGSPIINNELLPLSDDEPKINVAAFLRVLENLQDELDARREIMAASEGIQKRKPLFSSDRGSFVRAINENQERPSLINLAKAWISAKRAGLDLGLGRGFSGAEAAKHMMGMAAANFAGGPGRRRRSTQP